MTSIFILSLLFLIIAILYSSVGFGGGTGYIAILLLAGMAMQDVRFTALICNILVVFGSTIQYIQAREIPWRKILPITFASLPLAFIGGSIELKSETFILIAGVALIIASALLFKTFKATTPKVGEHSDLSLAGIGGGIGFLSGLIGIGGGIFLAPILYLIRWEKAIVISATASFFILVNSIAGLLGQLTNRPSIDMWQVLILGGTVLIGGQIGNRLNMKLLKPHQIKFLTAILVGFVGLRILILRFDLF